jgi:hypothetical protein
LLTGIPKTVLIFIFWDIFIAVESISFKVTGLGESYELPEPRNRNPANIKKDVKTIAGIIILLWDIINGIKYLHLVIT